ncbi:MAG: NAD-dependent deacylase [Gammaproteobacteria bacterium]|nr:NAD-dependent deacylase [Gammaproteobacteria bacterium]|tara:strand:- start:18642 stop:19400 length:759 start_codon:yes stop_codon:yes gene_type:complete
MNVELLTQAREILDRAERVAVFSGAGLSAESGISTFRGQEPDALWSRFDPMQLASVEGFAADPQTVIDWYNWRRSKLAEAQPNAAHQALAGLPELIHLTQNVDDLLERAGVPESNVLHLHGSIIKDRCHATCGIEEEISLTKPAALRQCKACGAYMRPAVVWFGEILPQAIWSQAQAVCMDIDCLLVIGTSSTVYPAVGLVELATRDNAQIIVVNTQISEASLCVDIELIGRAGEILPKLLDGMSSESKGSE